MKTYLPELYEQKLKKFYSCFEQFRRGMDKAYKSYIPNYLLLDILSNRNIKLVIQSTDMYDNSLM